MCVCARNTIPISYSMSSDTSKVQSLICQHTKRFSISPYGAGLGVCIGAWLVATEIC